ncbi:37s ribosomal mrp10 [Fusarium coicis]|nr:37s ribosomal mrp10 [Fusarium coicis]
MTGRHKAIRLPPLKTLRVHNPKRQVENPCIAIMSSVLGKLPLPHGSNPIMSTSFENISLTSCKHAGPQQATTQRAAQQ